MNCRLAVQFPEQRNALVFVLGPGPVDEVEPFASLDRPFRISQLVLVSRLERTHARMAGGVAVPPATREDASLESGTLLESKHRLSNNAL